MGCMEIESARHHHHRSRSPIRCTMCVRTMGPRAPPIPPASSRRFRLLAPHTPSEILNMVTRTPQSFWGPPRVRQRAYEMRLHHWSFFHFQYVWHAVWAAISPCVHHCAEGQSFHFASIRKENTNVRRVTQVRAWNQKTKKPSFQTESWVWDSKDVFF